MEQRLTLVTLGVSDYARAKAFYEALGWSAALEVEDAACFQGNGVILCLWAREKLGPDLGIPDDGARWSGIALAHNVRSREEVHEVIEQARSSGAQITREPARTARTRSSTAPTRRSVCSCCRRWSDPTSSSTSIPTRSSPRVSRANRSCSLGRGQPSSIGKARN